MNHLFLFGFVGCWAAILAVCWLGWQLLRQNWLLRLDELEKRLNELELGGAAGLPLDSLAPHFDLPDLAGERNTLAQCRGQTVLLIFFDPTCGFCRKLLPKLAALNNPASNGEPHSEQPTWPQLLIISTGDVEANRQLFSEHKVACPVLLQKDMEVSSAYKAKGTPTGYLINPEGKIASEFAVGAEALLALLSDQSKIKNQKSITVIQEMGRTAPPALASTPWLAAKSSGMG
jgi:peroxiredoxin